MRDKKKKKNCEWDRHLKIVQTWTIGDLQRKISSIPYRNAGNSVGHFHVFKAEQAKDFIDCRNY